MSNQITITESIAKELNIKVSQVEAVITLLEEENTVPFIARYRKEKTGYLDDTQLRILEKRYLALKKLCGRRAAIIQILRDQEKLTPDLERQIEAAATHTQLEDIYLPFRPKRQTKAQLARDAGLEPLAQLLLQQPELNPTEVALSYVNETFATQDVVLEGARQILMEIFAENATLLHEMREYIWQHGYLKSCTRKIKVKNINANKFSDYFDYEEDLRKIPSHRALALFRGRRENVLQLSILLKTPGYGEKRIASFFNIHNEKYLANPWLNECINLAWKNKIFSKLELELFARLREIAEEDAIGVFARNLRNILLSAPAGPHTILGLDPGLRSGIKAAVIDETGKVLDYTTLYPFAPHNDWHGSITELARLIIRFNVNLLSIGNGTGSRETEHLINDLMKMYPDLTLVKVIVNEAGASVYSASELASQELSELDVTIRGAVFIARRLQDPLAESVKVEPKALGAGQYQHDINPERLNTSLGKIVEDCVNLVGVNVNTASPSLLTYVAGLNQKLAKNIVEYRLSHGAFKNRHELKNVTLMGEKSFEQSAGFLRIFNGENALDASAVHPEAYGLVEKILVNENIDLDQLAGNEVWLNKVDAEKYVVEPFTLATVQEVIQELVKPTRDPRPSFKTATFKEGVQEIKDLKLGMILEGMVSNVTNFGAFVDIGVHQDGLVHISAMKSGFIKDPHQIVKTGDIVQVKVIEVDLERRRVGLSMKLEEEENIPVNKKTIAHNKKINIEKTAVAKAHRTSKPEKITNPKNNASGMVKAKPRPSESKKQLFNTAMADAFLKLKNKESPNGES